MTKGVTNFTSDELALVLSHYDLGTIYSATALNAGNRKAPKRIISSDMGKFVLKRRPHGKDDLYRVAFAHAVQNHLSQHGFPVAELAVTRDKKNTVLNLNNHVYELFEYIPGKRYNQTDLAAKNAGTQLGNFHRIIADFPNQFTPLKETYHDSSAVRGHLRAILKNDTHNNGKSLAKLGETLSMIYNYSSTNVNQLGFEKWPEQIIHGDWHPGNMLFDDDTVIAVLDFDSVKIAPVICDLANGLLHFSIVGGRPNPSDWPDYLDEKKLETFLKGYRSENNLSDNMLSALPDLMIETMIAEAVMPIAATGSFGHLCGNEFLKMILRKCLWIKDNHKQVIKQIFK